VVKKTHTDKNLLIANEATRQIMYLSPTYPGTVHDKKLAELAKPQFPKGAQLTLDLGFDGYRPAHVHLIQPKKQRRGQFLSLTDRAANRLIASARILIEHLIAGVKRCRIVTDLLRQPTDAFSDTVILIACGLHNLRTQFRYLASWPYKLKSYFR
jgi:hypothetical protein